MKKAQRTAAEQQIEALRQLKATQAKRRPSPVPAPKPAPEPRGEDAPVAGAFELKERAPRPSSRRAAPSLPLSVETWRRLRERQREHHEFRLRREMGDWAAELLLALPPGVYNLGESARRDLLDKLQAWARARGL